MEINYYYIIVDIMDYYTRLLNFNFMDIDYMVECLDYCITIIENFNFISNKVDFNLNFNFNYCIINSIVKAPYFINLWITRNSNTVVIITMVKTSYFIVVKEHFTINFIMVKIKSFIIN